MSGSSACTMAARDFWRDALIWCVGGGFADPFFGAAGW